jgi:hypothetical protein
MAKLPTDTPIEEFKQEQLPEPTYDHVLNILPTPTGSVLSNGEFVSPNFRTGQTGWRIDANGNAEFQGATIGGYVISSRGTFGGDGSDGALTISSGTTTIDLANSAEIIKNYTSISITGTGKLTFSNPNTNGTTIVLRSKGNVTLTSSTAPMIDASGMGAAGGAGRSTAGDGNNGSNGISFSFVKSNYGAAGTTGGGSALGGLINSITYQSSVKDDLISNYPQAFTGSGGGGGAESNSIITSGTGGRGGGGLIIECVGSLNFTTASGISVAGIAGGNASGSDVGGYGGGGGGGGGGYLQMSYNTLTANSGTVTIAGGAGGSPAGGGSVRQGGAGGGSTTAGADVAVNIGPGGAGGTGYSSITQNNQFA